jgi:hypothetical protein
MTHRTRINYRRCEIGGMKRSRASPGGSLGGRLAAVLTTGPVPGPMRAAEDRPFPRRAYFTFKMRRSGTTVSTGAILIPRSPPPARQRPADCRGRRNRVRKFLALGS